MAIEGLDFDKNRPAIIIVETSMIRREGTSRRAARWPSPTDAPPTRIMVTESDRVGRKAS